jgi:putative ABC transport system permease protein
MPDWREPLRSRLSGLRLSPAREAEIIVELSQHLDERYEELRRSGLDDGEARRMALEELREPEELARHMRSLRQANVRPPVTMSAPGRFLPADLWQDLRYAIRALRKEPGFAAAAVLTLALGLGANTAIFGLVDATLLRPMPYPHPERLVMLWQRTQTSARGGVLSTVLEHWITRSRAFEAIGGVAPNVGGMVLAGAGATETIPRQWATAQVFDALGVCAIAGRTFLPSDEAQRSSVVVLSEAFWRTRFNADPAIVGRELRLDGGLWTVVGVVPEEAQLLGRTSIWALFPITGRSAGVRSLAVIGRMKAGVSMNGAAADMAAVSNSLAQEFPTSNAGPSVTLEPLRDAVVGTELRQTSYLFLGVVGFVLLICCANVANLLLARATSRKRELAVRSALGGSRARLVRQLLTESLTLATLGGVAGLAIGAAILEAAPSMIPAGLLPNGVKLGFDARVAVFCGVAALLVGTLFGLAPARYAADFSVAAAIASESRSVAGRGGRMRGLLVAGQVATAVILLYGAGLLLRTLLAVEGVDPGYRANSVLAMIVDPPGNERVPWLPFYQNVTQEVRAVPGVRSTAWATTLPMGRSYQSAVFFEVVGDALVAEGQRPAADYQIVSPDYFATLDLPVVAGRAFDDRDARGGAPVCMVNEAFVREHVKGRNPIGLKVAIRRGPSIQSPAVTREIAGVVRQVKARPNEAEELIQVYVPLAQDTPGDIFFLVRPVAGRADALAPPVRAALTRVDKEQLVSVREVTTLEAIGAAATSRHRFRAVLVIAFAALSLVLAMVGVFGVLAYSVQQRVRDFGVRRALGATSRDVLWLVAGSASRVIVVGATIGLAVSAALGRLLESVLFGVNPTDPATFACVTILLALTTAAATLGPAWRAIRIDPAVALRRD